MSLTKIRGRTWSYLVFWNNKGYFLGFYFRNRPHWIVFEGGGVPKITNLHCLLTQGNGLVVLNFLA